MTVRRWYSCSNSLEVGRGGVALVVGAGPGIGSAVVHKCVNEGMTVCAVRRNGDKLKPLLDEIAVENVGKCHGFACDARKEDQVKSMVENIERDSGPIELLVHNIGANIGYVPVAKTTSRQYMKLWEMTAFSAFLVARETSQHMKPRGWGTILFTGATASVRGSAGFSAFSGACMAKRALAQSLARELGPAGIHVAHVVVDGVVDNPNTRDYFGMTEEWERMSAVDGLLRPEDIADNMWNVHMQRRRSAWTHELDLRPWNEKW